LDHVAAAQRLRAAVLAAGGEWGPERYQWLTARYPDGAPESALAGLIEDLTAPDQAAPAAGTPPVLQVVSG